MFRKFSLLLCMVSLLFGGVGACKKKTAHQLAEEKVAALREVKRKNAIKFYNQLAKDYPNHPKAAEASSRAAQLEQFGKK